MLPVSVLLLYPTFLDDYYRFINMLLHFSTVDV